MLLFECYKQRKKTTVLPSLSQLVIYFFYPDILAVFLSPSLDVIFNIKKIGNLDPNPLVILFALGISLHVTQLNGLPRVFLVSSSLGLLGPPESVLFGLRTGGRLPGTTLKHNRKSKLALRMEKMDGEDDVKKEIKCTEINCQHKEVKDIKRSERWKTRRKRKKKK